MISVKVFPYKVYFSSLEGLFEEARFFNKDDAMAFAKMKNDMYYDDLEEGCYGWIVMGLGSTVEYEPEGYLVEE